MTIRRTWRGLAAVAMLCAATAAVAGPPAKAASDADSTAAQATARITSGSAVPAGFRANSLSWLSPQRGWVLGEAACGTGTCSYVIDTTDGGKTWHKTGQVSAPLATPATTWGFT
jgi:photosystem II stability/assembly factor-like uncharacterized protein